MNETQYKLDLSKYNENQENTGKNKKMSLKCKIIIGVVSILVIGAIAGVAIFLATKKDDDSDSKIIIRNNPTDTDEVTNSDKNAVANTDINIDTNTNNIKDINTYINTDITEINTNVNSDTKTDLNTEINRDKFTNINTDINTVINSDLNRDIKTDKNTERIIDINNDTNTNISTNTDENEEINTDLNKSIDSDSNIFINTDINIDTNQETNIDINTDIKTDKNSNNNINIDTDTNKNINSDANIDLETNKPIKEEETSKSTLEYNNTNINTEANTDKITNTNINIKTDSITDIIDIKTDINIEASTDLNTDINIDDNTNINLDKNTELNLDINTDSNTNLNTDRNTDLNIDKDDDTDTNINININSDINSEIKTDLNTFELNEEETTDKSTAAYFKDNEYNVSLEYKKNDLEILTIEKKIFSNIKGTQNESQINEFDYKCILGIDDEIRDESSNIIYYRGFLFILSTIYYNFSLSQINNSYYMNFHKEPLRLDRELIDMINKIDQDFIKNVQFNNIFSEDIEDDDKGEKYFIKFDFYQNGSYREIYKPASISEDCYNECKEILDIVLPKISQNLSKFNEINQEKNFELLNKRSNNIKKGEIQKAKYSIIPKSSSVRNLDDKELKMDKIRALNSSDNYYLSNKIDFEFNSNIEEIDNALTNTAPNLYKENNMTKLEINETGEAFSDVTKYRGSKLENNITTVIDENGLLKEIFATKYINLANQDFIDRSDKNVYNDENPIIEDDINKKDNNDDNNYKNELYIIEDITSLNSSIDYHVLVNYSDFGSQIINDINNKYINKHKFVNTMKNETSKLLNKIYNIFPINFLSKFELIEEPKSNGNDNDINNNENLKGFYGEENYTEKYYGFNKSTSYRKDFFKTNFLGIDIALGMASFYYPRTGNSYNTLKLDVGDLHFSHNLNSFKTNQPIITENLQQMSFKLLKLIYLTHKNLVEEKNSFTFDQIKENIKNIAENEILNLKGKQQNYNIEYFYSILSENKKKYQIIINNLINGLKSINNSANITNLTSQKIEETNLFDSIISNITEEIRYNIKDLEYYISLVNKEITKKNGKISLYYYEDYKGIIEEIKSFINVKKENYIKSYLNKIDWDYESLITDKKEQILNFNNLTNLKNIINENNILNYIFSKEEKKNILSNLNNIGKYIDSNINSYISKFIKSLKDVNITEKILQISNNFSEINNFINLSKNILNIDIFEDFFQKKEQIDIKVREIITDYFQLTSSNLYNLTNYIKELMNNESIKELNKIINITKQIKKILIDIKNQKYKNLIDYHKTYYENNIYELLRNLEESKETQDIFDYIFLNSTKAIIKDNALKILSYNLELAYEYLDEAMDYIDECNKDNSTLAKILGDCDYYLNDEFIDKLTEMSLKVDEFINKMDNESFLDIIKDYYYSIENNLLKNESNLNPTLMNDIEFSYLENISKVTNFNFTPIENELINLINSLKLNAYQEKNKFFTKFHNFTKKKDGTIGFGDFDILILSRIDTYECVSRHNDKKIIVSLDNIINHLKDEKERIMNSSRNENNILYYFYNYYKNLQEGLKAKSKEYNNNIELNLLLYEYKKSINNINLTNKNILNNLTALFEKITSDIHLDTFFNKIKDLSVNIESLLKLSDEKSSILNYKGENKDKIIEIIQLLRYIYEDINNSFEKNLINQINKIFSDKKKTSFNLIEKLIESILSDLNNYDYMENERFIINKELNSIKNIIDDDYNISIEEIINNSKIKNNNNLKFNDSIKYIENILYGEKSYISLNNSSDMVENNTINSDNIKNNSNNTIIYENNSYKNNTKFRRLEDEDLKKEIEFKREYERIKKIFIQNNYFKEIDKNIIPKIDINDINLILEQIKYNISYEANKIIDKYIIPESISNFENNYHKIIKNFENLYNLENDSNEILNQYNLIIPNINANFINEVEKDLNILYSKLMDIVSLSIKLRENNDKGEKIKFEDEKKKYYEIISGYIENANNINYNINNSIDNEYNKNKIIKNILLGMYKRIEEDKINNIKSYLKEFYSKYNNYNTETNNIFKLYEEKMKKGLFNSSYFNVYKKIYNQTYKFININNNKTTFQDIKKTAINLYENIFKQRNINISLYPNEIQKVIEEEKNNILEQIKTVIDNSIKEAKYTIIDGIYLQRHIINDLMNKIHLPIPKNKEIDNNLEIYYAIMEPINKYEKDFYISKMNSLFLENYIIFLNQYYRDNFQNEIKNKILLNDNLHFSVFKNYFEKFLKKKYEKSKTTFLVFYIEINERISFMYNDLKNSTYDLLDNKKKNKDSYLSFILKQNKDLLINNFLNCIFSEELMKNIFLTNEYKNSFVQNETISDILFDYIEKIITKNSSKEIINDYQMKKEYINSQINNENETDYLIENYYQVKDSKLYKSINNLYQQYSVIKYYNNSFYNNSFQLVTEYINNIFNKNFKINEIEDIINLYNNFSENLDKKIEDIFDNQISNISKDNTNYDSIFDHIDQTVKALENYSTNFIDEIKTYFNKLKLFTMIDGLNYIPIKKAEELRSVWDVPKERIRNLDEFVKEENNNNKNQKLRKLNNNYLKTIISESKKNILMKMENLFNISSLTKFKEYDTSGLFNSSCESFSLYDILNMTGNLLDDTNNLLLMIKSNNHYNKMKTKFENQFESFEIKEKSLQMISNLFDSEYLSGLFYFSPNKHNNHSNYAEKIMKNYMENNIEKKINDIIFNFCDTLENKLFNYTNNIAYKTIFSTYDIYTNLINNKTKTLNENDILKSIEFEKANYNSELMIKVIDKFKMFVNQANINGKNEIRLNLKIENDLANSVKKFIKDAIKDGNSDENIDKKAENNTDEKTNNSSGVSYSIDIIYSDEKVALEACYIVDLIEKYAKDIVPLYISCPKFPGLKLIVEPMAKYNVCFAIEYIDDISIPLNQLSFDFSCGAEAGLYVNLGLYLDSSIASINFALDMERIYVSGKIGLKLSIDFTEAKIILNLYALFSGANFKIFIFGRVSIFGHERQLFNQKLIDKKLKEINLQKNITFYLNNSEIVVQF